MTDAGRSVVTGSPRRARPVVAQLAPEELQQHATLLRSYADHYPNVNGSDEVIRSLHASWAACVADPSLRRVLLPVLFAIAKRPVANAPEREAALALCFLSFSLSRSNTSHGM